MSAWGEHESPAAITAVLSGFDRHMMGNRGGEPATNAAQLVARVLRVSHVVVLQLSPDTDTMLAQAGFGFGPDIFGGARFDTDPRTLIGSALASSEPVAVENFSTDWRFTVPSPLVEYGFASALCARIPCEYQTIGVLAAFGTEPRAFSTDDASCLRVVAGMLSVSTTCLRTREARRDDQRKIELAKQEWEATVDSLPHFICLVDEHKRIVRANRSIEHWLQGPIREVCGNTVHDVLHPDCRDPSCYMQACCADAWEQVLSGRHFEYEVEDRILNRYLDIQLRPTTRRRSAAPDTQNSLAVVVVQDITRIKHAEHILRSSNDRLEELIQARTAELRMANEQLQCEIVERRRIADELLASENEMRLLSAQLRTAQEVERKRIASELHDGLGQALSAIKFSLENTIALATAKPGGYNVQLTQALIPRLQSAIDEVRRISMDLRPSTLDDLGIIPTIAWFCREFRSIYPDILLDGQIAAAEQAVPAPLKTVIYRILQEALNNVARHAQAKHVRVELRATDSAIELSVEDDGVGIRFSAGGPGRMAAGNGFGIAGMRERAEFAGGTFRIGSGENRGTAIRVSWPCRCRLDNGSPAVRQGEPSHEGD